MSAGTWLRPPGAPPCSYRFVCSLCGAIVYFVAGNNNRNEKRIRRGCEYKFCPMCGQRMGAKPEEEERSHQ